VDHVKLPKTTSPGFIPLVLPDHLKLEKTASPERSTVVAAGAETVGDCETPLLLQAANIRAISE